MGNKRDILFEITEEYGLIISFKKIVREYKEQDEDLELDFEEERELNFMSSLELENLPPLSEADYIQLYTSEIYGNRDYVNEKDFSPKSISKTLYGLLRELYILNKDLVIDYKLDTNEGFEDWGSMCSVGEYFNYLFLIKIQCSESQFLNIVDLLINVNKKSLHSFEYIANEYVNLKKFTDSKKIHILNTNTKARRLGYLKLLGWYFKKYPQTPIGYFYKKYESFVIPFQKEIQESVNQKGVVTLGKKGISTGSSAKPYIELANSLGYINSLNRVSTISKSFKVYIELLKQEDIESPFKLTLLDKIFFGRSVIKNDFLYMSILLEIIYVRQNFSFIELKRIYQDSIVKRLKYFQQEYFYVRDRKSFEDIKKIEARVNGWEEPERYLEHVLMPRLNWLADLKFIQLQKSDRKEVVMSITSEGNAFFECICDWYDLNFDWILNPDEFIASFFPHIFSKAYNIDKIVSPTNEQVEKFVLNKINECFDIFKTMAANRVTLSQAISYVQYSTLTEWGLCLSRNRIDDMIRVGFKDLFIYKFQMQFNDGYLQKIKQ